MEEKVEKKPKDLAPTPQQLAFATDVVETGFKNITESYRKAYPNASQKWASVEAYQLVRNPKIKSLIEQIQQDIRAKFILLAPAALERLEDLADNADSEKVKLAANLELLDRGGLGKPQKIELSLPGIFGAADPASIKAEIRRKQEELERKDREIPKEEKE
jgi:hypothetical protein